MYFGTCCIRTILSQFAWEYVILPCINFYETPRQKHQGSWDWKSRKFQKRIRAKITSKAQSVFRFYNDFVFVVWGYRNDVWFLHSHLQCDVTGSRFWNGLINMHSILVLASDWSSNIHHNIQIYPSWRHYIHQFINRLFSTLYFHISVPSSCVFRCDFLNSHGYFICANTREHYSI